LNKWEISWLGHGLAFSITRSLARSLKDCGRGKKGFHSDGLTSSGRRASYFIFFFDHLALRWKGSAFSTVELKYGRELGKIVL